jgi:hypothetical protein
MGMVLGVPMYIKDLETDIRRTRCRQFENTTKSIE